MLPWGYPIVVGTVRTFPAVRHARPELEPKCFGWRPRVARNFHSEAELEPEPGYVLGNGVVTEAVRDFLGSASPGSLSCDILGICLNSELDTLNLENGSSARAVRALSAKTCTCASQRSILYEPEIYSYIT